MGLTDKQKMAAEPAAGDSEAEVAIEKQADGLQQQSELVFREVTRRWSPHPYWWGPGSSSEPH